MATGVDDTKQQEFKEKLEALNQIQRKQNLTPKAKDRRVAELERRFKLTAKTTITGSAPDEDEIEETLETEEVPTDRQQKIEEPEENNDEENDEDDRNENEEEPEEEESNDQEDEGSEDKDEEDDEKKPDENKDSDEEKPESDEAPQLGEESEEGLGEAGEGAGEGLAEGAGAEGAGIAEAGAAAAEGAEAAEAGTAAVGFFAATSEIWVPILAIFLIICLMLGLFFFITTAAIAYCNDSGAAGWAVWATSKVSGLSGNGDFCKALAINTNATPELYTGGRAGGGGQTTSFWEPADLVALGGVSIDTQTSDPRVRSCMLPKVQQIFAAANAVGINITITSAFRSGDFPSRHAFGEAVDIAIRPSPAKPWNTNTQISKLVQIAKNAGFTPTQGDTIDEYNNPVERTSGGHVHVEFNKISTSASYCALYPNAPAPI